MSYRATRKSEPDRIGGIDLEVPAAVIGSPGTLNNSMIMDWDVPVTTKKKSYLAIGSFGIDAQYPTTAKTITNVVRYYATPIVWATVTTATLPALTSASDFSSEKKLYNDLAGLGRISDSGTNQWLMLKLIQGITFYGLIFTDGGDPGYNLSAVYPFSTAKLITF